MSEQTNPLERPYISGAIDKFEGAAAVVTFADQSFLVPKDKLPNGAQEGSVVRIIISDDVSEQHEREQRAKTILNELLSGESV